MIVMGMALSLSLSLARFSLWVVKTMLWLRDSHTETLCLYHATQMVVFTQTRNQEVLYYF